MKNKDLVVQESLLLSLRNDMASVTTRLSESNQNQTDFQATCDSLTIEVSEQRRTIAELRESKCVVEEELENRLNEWVMQESLLQTRVHDLEVSVECAGSSGVCQSLAAADLRMRLDQSVDRETSLQKQVEELQSSNAQYEAELERVTTTLADTSTKLSATEKLS